jgi:hypothetical protein
MQGDPRWITTRKPATCLSCGRTITRGEQAYFYPNSQSLYCDGNLCGKHAARDFEAHRQDEDGFWKP